MWTYFAFPWASDDGRCDKLLAGGQMMKMVLIQMVPAVSQTICPIRTNIIGGSIGLDATNTGSKQIFATISSGFGEFRTPSSRTDWG